MTATHHSKHRCRCTVNVDKLINHAHF